jgi:hypothetical protein
MTDNFERLYRLLLQCIFTKKTSTNNNNMGSLKGSTGSVLLNLWPTNSHWKINAPKTESSLTLSYHKDRNCCWNSRTSSPPISRIHGRLMESGRVSVQLDCRYPQQLSSNGQSDLPRTHIYASVLQIEWINGCCPGGRRPITLKKKKTRNGAV